MRKFVLFLIVQLLTVTIYAQYSQRLTGPRAKHKKMVKAIENRPSSKRMVAMQTSKKFGNTTFFVKKWNKGPRAKNQGLWYYKLRERPLRRGASFPRTKVKR